MALGRALKEISMSNEMIVSFPGGRRVNASYKGFEIETDQSVKNGGEASAPEPFDLFLASLATCAGAYVVGFCGNREIDTEDIRIVQRWERDKDGNVVAVSLKIEVPEEFPEKYHEALVRVAAKCSVKKTIQNAPEFNIETVVREAEQV
jgi:ribosomal protein S12 methylthiotransferase accessory factor